LLQVQQLLLTTCWHMSEALFVDCWHALGAAIREAQEIGSHTLSPPGRVSPVFQCQLSTPHL
jgi:hypothetical protein